MTLLNCTPLMTEVPHTGEYHRHPELVRRRDHVAIAHRAARLNHGDSAGPARLFDAIREREKRVRGNYTARKRQPGSGRLDYGNLHRIDAAHLSRATPHL